MIKQACRTTSRTRGTRQHLLVFMTRAANSTRHDDHLIADRTSKALLDAVGKSLRTIAPPHRCNG
jgi:hypothetical protein